MTEQDAREYFNERKNIDFLGKADYLFKKENQESKLVYGKHWKKRPFITIVIPAYRRPKMLERALKSAMNQKKFSDFQVLIVDDSCDELLNRQNEEIVKRLDDGRIIYYKNLENLAWYNWNRLLELSQTEWICMLHDDDVLHELHLYYMTEQLKRNSHIAMLLCRRLFVKENVKGKVGIAIGAETEIRTEKITYTKWNFQFGGLMLGGLFKREYAIKLGGFNDCLIALDFEFIERMAFHYNVYEMQLQTYGYGIYANESMKSEMWEKMLIDEYLICRNIISKRNIFFQKTLYKIEDWSISKHAESMSRPYLNIYGVALNAEKVCAWLGVNYNIRKNDKYLILRKLVGYLS